MEITQRTQRIPGAIRKNLAKKLVQRFTQRSLQENVDQVTFVFGASFVVIYQIGSVSDRVGGFLQMSLDYRARTCK